MEGGYFHSPNPTSILQLQLSFSNSNFLSTRSTRLSPLPTPPLRNSDFAIISGIEKFFNIAGPCNPANHYMLPATARLPDVASLIRKQQYFVIHAQRQCGKTMAILALRNEIHSARIELAKKLISDGDGQIGGLHLRCGFSSPATFRRVFKSFTGVSPQVYRQKSATSFSER